MAAVPKMLSVRDERFHLQLVLQREYLHVQSQLVLQKRLQQRKQSAELTGVWTPALPEFRRRLVLAAGQRGCAPRWLSRHETYPSFTDKFHYMLDIKGRRERVQARFLNNKIICSQAMEAAEALTVLAELCITSRDSERAHHHQR
ncbi:hypothetical protein MRX96_012892 [Rhipicephalus microplus]